MNPSEADSKSKLQNGLTMLVLVVIACLLLLRLVWLYLSLPENFPINTVKISAPGTHISKAQLESLIEPYLHASFFSFKSNALRQDLLNLDWASTVNIERIWPDTIKIIVDEKIPVAIFNQSLITKEGVLFDLDGHHQDLSLPMLQGPKGQEQDVLHVYQKLSMILSRVGLHVEKLRLSRNQAYVLTLPQDIQIVLGKKDIEQRLKRFCKAYPNVFADKTAQLHRIDLRYQHGMAVRWKNNTES